GGETRCGYRRTSVYGVLLDSLKKPEFLRDGADRSIEIEKLAVAALVGVNMDGRSGWVDIWNAERNAIELGDIPYFTALAGTDNLSLGPDQNVPGWFALSGHADAVDRLCLADESDLAFQVDLIR